MKAVKYILGIKLALALVLILKESGVIQFGERESFAEGENKSEEKTEVKKEKSDKNFIDDLIELPELNGDKTKKDEINQFLKLAERKRSQVDERIALLKKREASLVKLEKQIDQKLGRIDEERKFLAQTIQQEKELKGERLKKLIELYDKMEPKKAAPLLEKIDKDLAVELFKNLKQKQISTILELMNPTKSAELTEYFGRVRSMREYDLLQEMNKSLRVEFDQCKTATLPPQSPVPAASTSPSPVASPATSKTPG